MEKTKIAPKLPAGFGGYCGMNSTVQKDVQPTCRSVFHRVGENLYRLESSGAYYGLLKKGGKQFRRSLKTGDRKLAERRLKELKDKIGVTEEANRDFKTLAGRWLDFRKHKLAESTAGWYSYFIKSLRVKTASVFVVPIPDKSADNP